MSRLILQFSTDRLWCTVISLGGDAPWPHKARGRNASSSMFLLLVIISNPTCMASGVPLHTLEKRMKVSKWSGRRRQEYRSLLQVASHFHSKIFFSLQIHLPIPPSLQRRKERKKSIRILTQCHDFHFTSLNLTRISRPIADSTIMPPGDTTFVSHYCFIISASLLSYSL